MDKTLKLSASEAYYMAIKENESLDRMLVIQDFESASIKEIESKIRYDAHNGHLSTSLMLTNTPDNLSDEERRRIIKYLEDVFLEQGYNIRIKTNINLIKYRYVYELLVIVSWDISVNK